MFSPHEIWQWRQEVDVNPELRLTYAGRQLASIEIGFPEESQPEVELIGEFRPPADIFGRPADPTCLDAMEQTPVHASAPVVKTYPEARIVGFSALFSEDKLEISYAAPPRTAREFMDWNSFGAQGFIAEQLEDRVFVHFEIRPQAYRFDLHALFFPNLEPGNYGSFLFRSFPHMLHLAQMEPSADCYIVAERTSWVLEALRLLGFPPRPVYTAAEISGDVFASITMCTMHDMEGFIRPETRRAIRQLAGDVGVPAISGDAKIYLSRDLQYHAHPSYRPLTNEGEIQTLAASLGFQIVRPETMSLREQMRVFGSASHIIGASGSGMLNTIFGLRPARVVDIESYSVCVRQHARVYASCGHDYAFAFGDLEPADDRALHLRRWSLPGQAAKAAFEWCLR